MIKKIKIPDHVARNANGTGNLVTPIVETYGKSCEDTTVYMADVNGFGLAVWSNGRTFRLEADVFRPEQQYADVEIANENFTMADGVFGMALSPVQNPEKNRFLVFRPLSSRSVYAADTRVLQRSRYGSSINYYRGKDFLSSQATTMAFSSDGILFYALTQDLAIGCWNMVTPFQPEYFVGFFHRICN